MKYLHCLIIGITALAVSSVEANPGLLKDRKVKKVKIELASKDADKVAVARSNYSNQIENRSEELVEAMEACSSKGHENATECRSSVLEGNKSKRD